MKLAALLMLTALCSFTSPSGGPEYDEVVTLPEHHTKANIYTAAKQAMVSIFKDSKEVIQAESLDEGYIIGKGFYTLSHTDTGKGSPKTAVFEYKVWFTIKLSFKDDKYRIHFSDFTIAQRTTMAGGLFSPMVVGQWGDPGDISYYQDCAAGLTKTGKMKNWEDRVQNVCKWLMDECDRTDKADIELFKTQINKNLTDQNW